MEAGVTTALKSDTKATWPLFSGNDGDRQKSSRMRQLDGEVLSRRTEAMLTPEALLWYKVIHVYVFVYAQRISGRTDNKQITIDTCLRVGY